MKNGVSKIKVIVCTDERGGYLFNCRRVSSDRAVVEDILDSLEGNHLWVSPYTAGLFKGTEQKNICVDETYIGKADCNDYCMIEEKVDLSVWTDAEEIVIYKWNRVYPYDTVFPQTDINKNFHVMKTEEFTGNSHEKITKEVYSR